jgi:O-acetyl-ADP-ribose deacetylase (regulator of RNase III)
VITFKTGDLFESNARVLVNAINAGGVMGKGIALQFKLKFQGTRYLQDYIDKCLASEVSPRKPHVFKLDDGRTIVGLVTKTNFWEASTLAEVAESLAAFRELAALHKWPSAALPALGCGLGGLDWRLVKGLIEHTLEYLDCNIEVYEPHPAT